MESNRFSHTQQPVDNTDLDAVERRFAFSFPREVREHYLQYNGGSPEKCLFQNDYVVHEFLPVKHGEHGTLEDSIQHLKVEAPILPDYLVPFAIDPGGDYYCFSIRPQDHGAIYFFAGEFYEDTPERAVKYLARSLPEFLGSLTEDED